MNVDKNGIVHQPNRKWYNKRETDEIYAKGGHVVLMLKGQSVHSSGWRSMDTCPDEGPILVIAYGRVALVTASPAPEEFENPQGHEPIVSRKDCILWQHVPSIPECE